MLDVTLIVRRGLFVGFLAMALPALPGCNTVEGAGEDIEDAGEAVQEGAEEVEEDIEN